MKLHFCIAFSIIFAGAGICFADEPTTAPTTAPAADGNAGDSPAQAEVRAYITKVDVDALTWTLAQTRASMYTTTDAEAEWTDFMAHEVWAANQLEKAVRDKWGPEGHAKFMAVAGGTTLEQDKTADITVDGDHATVANADAQQEPARLIKIKGKWLFDQHAYYAAGVEKDPRFGRVRVYHAPVCRSLVDDLKAGKYDDLDAFLGEFKTKYEEVEPVDLDQ